MTEAAGRRLPPSWQTHPYTLTLVKESNENTSVSPSCARPAQIVSFFEVQAQKSHWMQTYARQRRGYTAKMVARKVVVAYTKGHGLSFSSSNEYHSNGKVTASATLDEWELTAIQCHRTTIRMQNAVHTSVFAEINISLMGLFSASNVIRNPHRQNAKRYKALGIAAENAATDPAATYGEAANHREPARPFATAASVEDTYKYNWPSFAIC